MLYIDVLTLILYYQLQVFVFQFLAFNNNNKILVDRRAGLQQFKILW